MTIASHIAELKKKHDKLKGEVKSRHKRRSTCLVELAELKKEKLKLKDQIRRLEVA